MPGAFTTPYVSSVYDSPNLIRIADLMRQQGVDRAAAIQRSGDLSANMWSNLGVRIGDLINTPRQVRDQQMARQTEATRNALAQEQLTTAKTANTETQKRLSEEDQIGALLSSNLKPDANGNLRYDVESITKALPPTIGTRGPSLIDSLTKANDLQDATAATSVNRPLAYLSKAALQAYDASSTDGADALDRFGASLHLAVLNKQLTQDQATAYLGAVQGAKDPKRALIGLMAPTDRPKTEIREQAPGASTVQIIPGLPPQTLSTSPAKLPNSQEADFAIPIKGTLTNVKGSFVPGADGKPGQYIYNGQDVTAQARKAVPERDPIVGELAAQRLADAKAKAAPLDISPDIQTSAAGAKYIDGSLYSAEQRDRAREAAGKLGVVMISKEQANAIQEIDNARANQKSIMTNIGDLLPKGPGGRIIAMPTTALETIFQTNDQKAAFASWRTAAIQTLRATAGSKGLRINQAEIAQAIENDIPKLTDTLGTAQQKIANINTLLDNAERSIVVRDRSKADTPAPIAAPALTPGLKRLGERP